MHSPSVAEAPIDEMGQVDRVANLLGVILPVVGVVVAIVLLWNRAVDGFDLALLGVTYLLTGFGVTVGYHRLLTHRSFQTSKPLEYLLAALGSSALQGSVLDWVADHRKHHAHADEEGDPHSPHVGDGAGLRGLWHAHVGWLFDSQGRANWKRYAPDLYEDPGMRTINRMFPLLTVASVALPAAAGWAYHGNVAGALRGFVWAGLVRIFLLHHVTWSINSICHFFGTRRFQVDDESGNVAWLAVPSLGEAWHHNHHAFPRSAFHGLRWWEIDLTGLVIRGLEALGLARRVTRIAPERQEQRRHQPAARRQSSEATAGEASRA
jgi:stearoyl-CoA desaturase (delta-9 desaturase)